MFKSKYGNLLTGLLIVVIIGIVAIIGYFGYKILTEDMKAKDMEKASEEFDSTFSKGSNNNNSGDGTNVEINGVDTNTTQENGNKKMYKDGYEVVAKLCIPTTKVDCIVFEELTKKSLETGLVKLYSTNGLNQPGNTVIIGHNYRTSLFFGRNDELKKGDKVYLKDTSGEEIEYEIYNIFITTSNDSSFYQRETEGKRELTLSTCTDDASTTDKRLIIFAREVER